VAIVLCDPGTPPGIDPAKPASWQLADLYANWLPRPIETHLLDLNQRWPLAGLFPQVERREITLGQWRLYVGACLQGQILNGGVEQFVFNCPGLVRDAKLLTGEVGPDELAKQYEDAIRRTLAVLDKFAAVDTWAEGDALAPLWAAYEQIELPQDDSHYLDAMFIWEEVPVPKHGEQFAASLVKTCLQHPEDFVSPS
jgi:hypothetical protein